MPDPSSLRDSTQIVLPADTLDGLRGDLIDEYEVTVFEESEDHVRIIGSPVEIKGASEFLTRHGISLR